MCFSQTFEIYVLTQRVKVSTLFATFTILKSPLNNTQGLQDHVMDMSVVGILLTPVVPWRKSEYCPHIWQYTHNESCSPWAIGLGLLWMV